MPLISPLRQRLGDVLARTLVVVADEAEGEEDRDEDDDRPREDRDEASSTRDRENRSDENTGEPDDRAGRNE
jgi:hypothetical protein